MNNHRISSSRFLGAVIISLFFLASCKQDQLTGPGTTSNPGNPQIPKSPGTIMIPADNLMTPEKVELGRHLFFDKELSVDGSTACATCHDPSIGFADLRGQATSMGFAQRMGTRNAPSLANIAYNTFLTWDGRFPSLEKHAAGPIFNSLEMGNNFSTTQRDTTPSDYNSGPGPFDTNFLFKRLIGHTQDPQQKGYADLFVAAWGSSEISVKGVSMDHIQKSIACFERTFISTQSMFDQYNNGSATAYKNNAPALQGFQLFTGKANCVSCHNGYNFTDQQFHNNGIGVGPNNIFDTVGGTGGTDIGRMSITKKQEDRYKFKTPSLRNVALTAPYMHDGRYSSLADVINKNYNHGGNDPNVVNKDPNIKALNLTPDEVTAIVEFLKTLNDPAFTVNPNFANPWLK